MEPWTESHELGWRPSISFYENRIRFLRGLSDREMVAAFRVDADGVEVKLGDRNHEVALSAVGATCSIWVKGGDWERCAAALDLGVSMAEPTEIRSASLQYAHVIEVPMDYDEARVAAARAWFGSWIHNLQVVDHALLLDGRIDSPPFRFKVEFGIVQRSEVRGRLERHFGRVEGERRRLSPDWDGSQVPDVAIFADSVWWAEGMPPPSEAVAWLSGMRNVVHDRAVELLESLRDGLL